MVRLEDGIPSINQLVEILKEYGKEVSIETINYQYALSKKQNLKEVLIIGKWQLYILLKGKISNAKKNKE